MGDTVFVPLMRTYGWHDEQGNYTDYGPGAHVGIPRKMAEGLVKAGVLSSVPDGSTQPAAIAQRQAELAERAAMAAGKLAERLGLADEAAALEVLNDDSDQARLLRAEFVAEFLERLAESEGDVLIALEVVAAPSSRAADEVQLSADEIVATTERLLLARIDAIDGIGPKTMELIRKGLQDSELAVTVQMDSEKNADGEANAPDGGGGGEQP